MAELLSYKVVLEPAEEGGYTVSVPALPGCITEGNTHQGALQNTGEAIEGWSGVAKEFGDEIFRNGSIIDTVTVPA